MKLEISKEIVRLAENYRGKNSANAVISGMAFALLTDEQGQYIIELLNKWIGEKN